MNGLIDIPPEVRYYCTNKPAGPLLLQSGTLSLGGFFVALGSLR